MAEPGAELFYKILSIVGFNGDREAFFKEFVRLCNKRALQKAMSEISEDARKKLVASIESNDEDIDLVIEETIGKGNYAQKVLESTSEELQRYVKKVGPLLAENHKQELVSLSEELLSELSAVK
jgi:hypothetical protein